MAIVEYKGTDPLPMELGAIMEIAKIVLELSAEQELIDYGKANNITLNVEPDAVNQMKAFLDGLAGPADDPGGTAALRAGSAQSAAMRGARDFARSDRCR